MARGRNMEVPVRQEGVNEVQSAPDDSHLGVLVFPPAPPEVQVERPSTTDPPPERAAEKRLMTASSPRGVHVPRSGAATDPKVTASPTRPGPYQRLAEQRLPALRGQSVRGAHDVRCASFTRKDGRKYWHFATAFAAVQNA